jgi:hypothetical protein
MGTNCIFCRTDKSSLSCSKIDDERTNKTREALKYCFKCQKKVEYLHCQYLSPAPMKFSYLNAPPVTFLYQLAQYYALHTCSMATVRQNPQVVYRNQSTKTYLLCRQYPVFSRYATFQTNPLAVQL